MRKRLLMLPTLVLSLSLLALPAGAADKPLDLSQSIDIALHNNLDLDVAKRAVNIASFDYDKANGAKKGYFTLDNSYRHYDKTQSSVGSSNLYSSGINLNLPIYTGGKLEATKKSYEYNLEGSKANLETTKQDLIYKVKEAYYSVLKALRLTNVAQESLDGTNSHLKVAKAQFDAGMAAKYDVLRAEVEVANAKQQLIKAKNGVDLAKSSFNNVLNRDLSSAVNLVDVLDPGDNGKLAPLSQLVEKAFQQRPEITQLNYSIKSAQEGVKVAAADKKPTLSLTGGYQWIGDQPFDKSSWNVGVVSQYTWYVGNITGNSIKSAQEKFEQAKTQLEKAKQGIALDVRQAYLNIQESQQALTAARKSVDQAKEGLKIAEVRYKSGMGTSVERLDAQTALTQAETNYAQALYDYNLAQAQLSKALGENK